MSTAIASREIPTTFSPFKWLNFTIKCVICGGISDVFHNMLHGQKIGVIAGRAGAVEQVLQAYLCDRLDQPCFLMPGYKICVCVFAAPLKRPRELLKTRYAMNANVD